MLGNSITHLTSSAPPSSSAAQHMFDNVVQQVRAGQKSIDALNPLIRAKGVTKVDLPDIPLDNYAGRSLLHAAFKNPWVGEPRNTVFLSNNNLEQFILGVRLSDVAIEGLTHTNARHVSITATDLSDPEHSTSMAKAIQRSKVPDIDVSFDLLGNHERGAIAVAEAIKDKDAISFNVSWNNLGLHEAGAIATAEAIKHAKAAILYLSFNSLGQHEAGAIATADAIKHAKAILLDLSGNSLGQHEAAGKALWAAIQKSQVKQLILRGNELGSTPEKAAEMARAVARNPHLEEIDLTDSWSAYMPSGPLLLQDPAAMKKAMAENLAKNPDSKHFFDAFFDEKAYKYEQPHAFQTISTLIDKSRNIPANKKQGLVDVFTGDSGFKGSAGLGYLDTNTLNSLRQAAGKPLSTPQ